MGFLDNAGLSHFWEKVLDALGEKQDKLAPDDSIVLADSTIGVALPTKAVTQAEYDALSEEEKQEGVLYVVDEPQWVPTPLSVQEYDTDDGWHVRKWSDGYVEMSLVAEEILKKSTWSAWGGVYDTGSKNTMQYPYPIVLKTKYFENCVSFGRSVGSAEDEAGSNFTLLTCCSNINYKDKTGLYDFVRPDKLTNDLQLNRRFFVFGRWK